MRIYRLLIASVPFFFLPALSAYAEPVDYLRDVKPILHERCYACHGALEQEAGLRLDTAALVRTGGDGGPAIEPGRPDQSLLIEKIIESDESLRMPLDSEPLSDDEIAVLKTWIEQGASAPADEQPQQDPRHHWAFVPPLRPSIPSQFSPASADNPIDVLIGVQHHQRRLKPVPPADRPVLLRRVYLDLVGLAPSRDQLHTFLDDQSEDALTRVVDRLLASPRYGERWGRHWMDVWRYCDPFEILGRRSQPNIWHWRDWIVESLNGDKGYDRMIVEMLAADELVPTDADAIRGTGFVARNYFHFDRNVWLDNLVDHTGKAFLGLTLKCSRCHDHKFDPIAQREYYQIRAVFEPHRVRMHRLPGRPDAGRQVMPRVFDADLNDPTYVYLNGNEKWPDKDNPVSPGLPARLSQTELNVVPVRLPGSGYYPALQEFVVQETLDRARAAVSAMEAKLAAESANRDLAEKRLESALAKLTSLEARIAVERAIHIDQAADADRLARAAVEAEYHSDLMEAELRVLEAEVKLATAYGSLKANEEKAKTAVLQAESQLAKAISHLDAVLAENARDDRTYSNLGTIYPAESSGRRLALARWITDRQHPLTARVAVNHIWLRHFGQPLVPTVFDFGLNGKPPSHPRLLDWLAVEFMEQGWSMKWLHRTIITSQAYRSSSSSRTADAATYDADPENRYLWRMNSRRMESQIVRDNVLHLAGKLDSRMAGPELAPDQSEKAMRRSLYFRHSEKERISFLLLFDDANVNECYRREESITPQQALAMANSRLVMLSSRELAAALSGMLGGEDAGISDAQFIQAAFETILSRSPTSDERAVCEQALDDMKQLLISRNNPDAARKAREHQVHVLMNHNDFVTIR